MERSSRTRVSWGTAIARGAVVVVVAVVLFLIVPDRLLEYLSLHLVPFWRDATMIAYTAIAFVAMCWVFVRLQRVRG